MLCCKMCSSLMMAFGFKMGNNRDSDGMEEMKISGNTINVNSYEVYQVLPMSDLHNIFMCNYCQKQNFLHRYVFSFFIL